MITVTRGFRTGAGLMCGPMPQPDYIRTLCAFDGGRVTSIEQVIADGPFQASWNSLRQYTAPDWYPDARFGIFIHWGLYSVPAFGNEWYPRKMYLQGSEEFQHYVKTCGPHTKSGYKDFVPLFKAEKYDPGQWAKLFKESGARYVASDLSQTSWNVNLSNQNRSSLMTGKADDLA